jgi:hypothetical protein
MVACLFELFYAETLMLQQCGKHGNGLFPSHISNPSMLFQDSHKWLHIIVISFRLCYKIGHCLLQKRLFEAFFYNLLVIDPFMASDLVKGQCNLSNNCCNLFLSFGIRFQP